MWDKNISLSKAKKILQDESQKEFVEIAAVLLARKNVPRQIFEGYISKEIFVRNWSKIKKRMRQNHWNNPRIEFWQAIYEKVLEVYRAKGFSVRQQRANDAVDDLCEKVGENIRKARKDRGLTQKAMADKMGISQQIISQIEKGRHNVSILTIKRIARVLGKDVEVTLR